MSEPDEHREKCDLCNREVPESVPESQLTLALEKFLPLNLFEDWVCEDCWWEAYEESGVEE